MQTPTRGSNAPWLKRRWANGRIRDRSGTFIAFSVGFALIFDTLAVLVTWSVWQDHSQGAGLFVLSVILIALGGLATAWAKRQIMVRVKFGRSIFEMETFPGVVGGYLAGMVRPAKPFAADKRVHLELECICPMRVDSFGKVTATEDVQLHARQTLDGPITADEGRQQIPVSFAIPADAPPTRGGGRHAIFWRLRVRVGQRGADYDSQFIVPVFEVPGANMDAPQAETLAAPLRTSQSDLKPTD